MDQTDKEGKYWLKFNGNEICSQCNKPIKEGDKIYIDADGFYHKANKTIEIFNVIIYHHECLVDTIKDEEYR